MKAISLITIFLLTTFLGSKASAQNIGIGTTSPQARLDILGGNWDLTNSEGDLRIGNNIYRLKFGIALGGGGAGDASIMQFGNPSGFNALRLGSQ